MSSLTRNIYSISSILIAHSEVQTSIFFKILQACLIHQCKCNLIELIIIKFFEFILSVNFLHDPESRRFILSQIHIRSIFLKHQIIKKLNIFYRIAKFHRFKKKIKNRLVQVYKFLPQSQKKHKKNLTPVF